MQGSARYSHITSNATTALKHEGGKLFTITINTKGGSSNVATVYDSSDNSGNVIAVIDTTANVTTLKFGGDAGLQLTKGLCVITATGTAGDITVTYE